MQASLPDAWIAKATRYRYTLPILAELERDKGCKFVTLVRRLEASDRAVRQALDYLMDVGWVERNPGYGHPSRPEYIVTGQAHSIAANCLRIWDDLVHWDQIAVALERWPLLLLSSIGMGRVRFAELLKANQDLTPRSLSLALKRLAEAGLLSRDIVPGNPPITEYRATPWAKSLLAATQFPA